MTPSWFPSGPLVGPPRQVALTPRRSSDTGGRPLNVLMVGGEDVALDSRPNELVVSRVGSLEAIETEGIDVVVLCTTAPEAIRQARALALDTPIVVIGPRADALTSIEAGAEDAVGLDELELIGRVLRHAVTRKHSRELDRWLEHTNRLTALGTLAAGIAHEVNNPVTTALIGANMLAEKLADLELIAAPLDARIAGLIGEAGDLQSDVTDALQRIRSAIKNVESFARPQPDIGAEIDVNELAKGARRIVAAEVRERASYRERLRAAHVVVGDARQLEQVLVNLLINAAHAILPGNAGANYVAVETFDAPPTSVVIAVSDSGSGIAEENVDRIFEPFFTTKPREKGSGLGLWICARIVARMGGQIRVSSKVGEGSRFEVVLPAGI